MVNELLLGFLKDHPVAWQMLYASLELDLRLRSIIYSLWCYEIIIYDFSEVYVMLLMLFQWRICDVWYFFEYDSQLCMNYVVPIYWMYFL
jgi:hypothetical protein